MKKTIKSLLAIAVAAFAFTACSDVPEPYKIPTPGGGGGGDTPVIEGAEGTGQLNDPYNCIAALNVGKQLAVNATTDWMYIKGVVSSIKEQYATTYGNGTFYISADGTSKNQFYVYRALYLGNKKFVSGDTEIQKGDSVIICAKITNYNGTIETAQKEGFLYSLNGVNRGGEQGGGGGGEGTSAEAKGTGVQTDPYNVAGVLKYIETLGANVTSENVVYVKGKVKAVSEQFATTYGNATFTMIDEGYSAEFTAYRIYYFGNKKYTSGDVLKEGDEVIVCGKVVNYKGNTPETSQGTGYLYSLNGVTEGGGDTPTPSTGEAKGTGTEADPFNVAAAVAKCKEVGETATAESYYVKGIADADYTVTSYKNVEVDLVDVEGSSEKFKVFRVKALEGKDIKQGYKIEKGATIVVYGKLVNYKNNTPETAQNQAYLVSVNGQAPELDEGGSESGGTSGGGESGGGEVLASLTNGDFETWADGLPTGWKSASTVSSATLEQSTDAHGGSYAVIVKGDASNNKRLGSQEIKLEAGSYTFAFWVKPTTTDVSQVRPGYVIVADNLTYKYGEYVTLVEGWQQVSVDFTLDAESTVCLAVMNPKASSYSSGKDIIIDDATLTKK